MEKKEARLRFLFPLFLPLFEGEVALEHQARGYGVHRLFALLRVLAAGHEDIVRVHSRAPLIPKRDGETGRLAQQRREALRLFRPRAARAVHIQRVAEHQLGDAVLGDEPLDLRRDRLGAVGGDDGGEARKRQKRVGNGDAGVRVAVVNGHNFHATTSQHL